jgi:hypothetical protein
MDGGEEDMRREEEGEAGGRGRQERCKGDEGRE